MLTHKSIFKIQNKMQNFKFSDFFLKSYRFAAFFILFGTIAVMLGYLILVAFYTFNTSWAAPTIISPTNDKMLRLKGELFNANQTIDKINVDLWQLDNEKSILNTKKITLEDLKQRLDNSINTEQSLLQDRAKAFAPLLSNQAHQNQKMAQFSNQINKYEKSIRKSLKAGLITQEEAIKQRASALQMSNNVAESSIQSMLAYNASKDMQRSASTLHGENEDIKALDTISKRSQLETEIAQLNVQILSNENTHHNLQRQLKEITEVIQTLSKSPYFKITKGAKLNFAFLPYENQKNVEIGSPVYDCLLHLFLCTDVGKVSAIYTDEESIKHSLLKTDVRGSFIELSLTDKSAAKSQVLFVNSKPLFF
jgi:hypothetical protein